MTGKLLYESPVLPMEEKDRLFALSYRKLLFLIHEAPVQGRWAHLLLPGGRPGPHQPLHCPVADGPRPLRLHLPQAGGLLPGTFDPFTLSHKGIVHAIRDLGFEVYLAVDEFSWSKKAQPHLIRLSRSSACRWRGLPCPPVPR